MTENKRFTIDTFIADYPCGFKDLEDNECEIFCNGERMTYREVADLLNELDKENRKLKNELNLSKLNLKEKNEGFDKIHKIYMEQIEENKELKEKNKFVLWQIRAFRDDCYTAIDFDGASTLNRLLDILGEER